MKVLAVIPARYASSRFPGKPLADLGGKPMIQRVWERASQAKSLDGLLVATDDRRIKRVVDSFGGLAVMTPKSCPSGTDRIAAALKQFSGRPQIVLNIQGDEPLIAPAMIDQLAGLLQKSSAPMGTLARPLEKGDYANPNCVKAVFDKNGRALYFSRAAIPYDRDRVGKLESVGLHIGLYAYRTDFLFKLAKLKPTPLEKLEKLEQLRVLEHGYEIQVGWTRLKSLAVDTPADAKKIRRLL
jgi:3-deoxy-manno-octulosonate cytidylyltransferase (CMP-KDO synthetase)